MVASVVNARVPFPSRRLLTEPFRIDHTDLPENVLLLAKVITLAFIVTGQIRLLSWHFLPFLRFFDRMGPPAVFHWALVTVFAIAAAALFYNWNVRTCCFVLGGVILVSLLSSRLYFQNNRTYCACLLLLCGLCSRTQEPWPLRLQVVLLYAGAALNKVLQPDWRSGQFFAYWYGQIHHPAIWAHITAFVPGAPLAALACWMTIAIEFILVVGFLVPRYYPWAIWLGTAYHTALLVIMNTTFGMFYYAVLASYLAFVRWPSRSFQVVYDDGNKVGRFLKHLDIPKLQHWVSLNLSQNQTANARGTLVPNRLFLLESGRVYGGFEAVKRILILSPFAYFCLITLLAHQPHWFQYHRWLAAAVVGLFTPFLGWLGQWLYSVLAGRRCRVDAVLENERPATFVLHGQNVGQRIPISHHRAPDDPVIK